MLHIRFFLLLKTSKNAFESLTSKSKLCLKATALPRITIPHKIVQSLEKVKYKNLIKDVKSKPTYDKSQMNVIITCKRSEFNHYRGQTYTDFTPECLASKGWKSKKSKGDYFIINPSQRNPAFDGESPTFEDLKLNKSIIAALEECNIIKPTVIQSKVIPLLNNGESVLCAAETGNGKTLAYLLPMIERVLKMNSAMTTTTTISSSQSQSTRNKLNRPIAVVVAPSRELAEQIYSVASDLASKLGFYVDMKCGGRRTQSILRAMEVKPIDLLIASPGILSKLLTNKFYDISRLSMVAFDEADTLFDDSFTPIMLNVIKKLKVSAERPVVMGNDNNVASANKTNINVGLQVIFAGATMPKGLQAKLNEVIDMDSVEIVVTNHLHHLLPHIPHKFIRLGPAQKLDHLLGVIRANLSRPRPVPTIVFCNKPDTVSYLGHMMTSQAISHVTLHADMPQIVRDGRYDSFRSGDTNVFICTDLASRGLDTTRAQHVINYDFPNFISDYVHRAGRVGRVGSPHGSLVLSYVVRTWDVELLWKIESSIRRRTELPNVNANIKRKLDGLHSVKLASKATAAATSTSGQLMDSDDGW